MGEGEGASITYSPEYLYVMKYGADARAIQFTK